MNSAGHLWTCLDVIWKKHFWSRPRRWWWWEELWQPKGRLFLLQSQTRLLISATEWWKELDWLWKQVWEIRTWAVFPPQTPESCVDLQMTWIEEAFRDTLKVSLLFAASTKVWATTSFSGSWAVGIVLLNTTPISASVVSTLMSWPITRLHYQTQIEVIVEIMWQVVLDVTNANIWQNRNSDIEKDIFTGIF